MLLSPCLAFHDVSFDITPTTRHLRRTWHLFSRSWHNLERSFALVAALLSPPNLLPELLGWVPDSVRLIIHTFYFWKRVINAL